MRAQIFPLLPGYAILGLGGRGLSHGNIGMAKNSLDDFVRNSEPIEIHCDSTAETVPAAPHTENVIALVLVTRLVIML